MLLTESREEHSRVIARVSKPLPHGAQETQTKKTTTTTTGTRATPLLSSEARPEPRSSKQGRRRQQQPLRMTDGGRWSPGTRRRFRAGRQLARRGRSPSSSRSHVVPWWSWIRRASDAAAADGEAPVAACPVCVRDATRPRRHTLLPHVPPSDGDRTVSRGCRSSRPIRVSLNFTR